MPLHDDIPFARPLTGSEEEEAVIRVLRSGWLTTGGEALAFEKEFAEFLSNHHALKDGSIRCLAVNSATSGLHLALEACRVGPGDAVLVPSCTFTATAEVARYLGADPVFVDVAPGTFHMDPVALEQTLKRLPPNKARAVIPVHYGGLPCDMAAIMDIARRYGLKVIEDAAHAFPSVIGSGELGVGSGDRDSKYGGASRKQSYTPNNDPYSLLPTPYSPFFAGTIGDAGVFSFYATKTITTGEGGMIVCRDKTMADRMSVMRSHGIDRTVWNRYSDARASWRYEVVEAGYKYNLPDLLAAIGRVQLSRAGELLRMREAIAAAYDAAFSANNCLLIPPTGPGDARHLYPLRLNPQRLSIGRDEFINKLKESGIGVSVHYIPLHTMPYYKNRYQLNENDLPETIKSCYNEISLPIWPGMSVAQINRVIEAVLSITHQN
jgi:dTDP-4-amino-4,6-dideoxygalactose transaminase